MGFFNGLKRAFGFASDGSDRDDELDVVDGRVAREPYVNPFKSAVSEAEAAPSGEAEGEAVEARHDDDSDALRQRLADSEAQRRALQARANSLSERIATLESNQEQMELENKSLANKLKVAQVQNGDSGAAQHEVDELTAEFKSKMELTNVMLNEFRAEAARKTKELEELKQQLGSDNPHEEMLKAKVEEISDLKQQHLADLKLKDDDIAALRAQIGELEKQLAESADMEAFEGEIERQLQKVEEYKAKKAQEIADWKEKVAARDEQIATLQTTLAASEQVQVRLNKDIADLKKEAARLSERHNRRDIETANRISDLNGKLKNASSMFQQEMASLTKENHALKEALDLAQLELEMKAAEAVKAQQPEPAVEIGGQEPEAVVEPAEELEPETVAPASVDIPLDDEIDDLDWLVPSPVVEKAPEPESEPEPVSPPAAAKPAAGHQQLSLF